MSGYLPAFEAARALVKATLTDAGIKALDYLGEAISPPCVVAVPGEPYFQRPSGDGRIPFRKVLVGIDVLMLVSRGEAKTESKAIDDLIKATYVALKNLDDVTIRRISRPGVVTTVSGSKFVGSVLSIEALAEEP